MNPHKLPEVKMRISEKGMRQICNQIKKQEVNPVVDPYGKIEPFWTVVLPEGKLPEYDDAIKVTLAEYESIMKEKWEFLFDVEEGGKSE